MKSLLNRFGLRLACSLLMLGLLVQMALGASSLPGSGTVKALFADPPREYATAPLWVWNDMLTEQQVRETMRDLAGQKVKQVFVHPRPGLMTPYLSAEWFRLWKAALDEAKTLDMNVWIYDENSYPSGFAGGWVPELMPESRGSGLEFVEPKTAPQWATNTLAVYRIEGNQAQDVSAALKSGSTLKEGRYVVVNVVRAKNSPWHGDRCYVDLMLPGVTEKFLDVTIGAYKREVGAEFGKRIPGIFTDEPELVPAGGRPWTPDLAVQFKQRRGYDLPLASLGREVGDWKKVRHDYFRTLLELFIERWAKPYYECCESNNLEFTGHYWDHSWPNCAGVPDNMAMSAWQQRPGIDILMNQYAEKSQAQFGNVRACREISSLANQLGRSRTLVEIYGAGGWDLRFEDMKRIADWLEVLGVNTLDEHLSYVTLRGARKRDHPQSFSYHEPWWGQYHVMAGYDTRLSAALTQGKQVNRILVMEPTSTAWMYQGNAKQLDVIGKSFFDLLMALEAAQIEYDLGCEDVMARHGSVKKSTLVVGQRAYDAVIVPAQTETLSASTLKLLESYAKNKGQVYLCGTAPRMVDAVESPALQKLAAGWKTLETPALTAALAKMQSKWSSVTISRDAGDRGILFHHRRQWDDGDLLFLVNTSIEASTSGQLDLARAGAIEAWDPFTGKITPYPQQSGKRAAFNLPPCGSLMLFLSRKSAKPVPGAMEIVGTIAAASPVNVKRLEPNVFTLDYVDVTAGGATQSNVYYYQACQFAFKQNGMERNPWDSAVQFKDELIRKTFPPESGFSASYRFRIETSVPRDLGIVIERPDLYKITCNGQPVSAKPGAWWLDKAFGRIDISAQCRTGENVVTISAAPFTIWHEIEPAYLLGDFALQSAARGFVIVPSQPLRIASDKSKAGWDKQGCPFYSAGVVYQQTFEVKETKGRLKVSLPSWLGSVATVKVNGTEAGVIFAAPWECDVTSLVKKGSNTIEVIVIGTLKNTLGPLHGNNPLGSAWPRMFQNGPKEGQPAGENYNTVSYGLFEPFVLKQITTM